MPAEQTILIVDDDPVHLRIYGWIVEGAGFRAVPVAVRASAFDLPGGPLDLALLDYHLGGQRTAVEVAQLIRARFPAIPIVVLSDRWDLPDDIAPLVQGFVRKGEPAKLVAKLNEFLPGSP